MIKRGSVLKWDGFKNFFNRFLCSTLIVTVLGVIKNGPKPPEFLAICVSLYYSLCYKSWFLSTHSDENLLQGMVFQIAHRLLLRSLYNFRSMFMWGSVSPLTVEVSWIWMGLINHLPVYYGFFSWLLVYFLNGTWPLYRLFLIPQGNSLKQPRTCILCRGEKYGNEALAMDGCSVVLKVKLILCLVFN